MLYEVGVTTRAAVLFIVILPDCYCTLIVWLQCLRVGAITSSGACNGSLCEYLKYHVTETKFQYAACLETCLFDPPPQKKYSLFFFYLLVLLKLVFILFSLGGSRGMD